MTNSNAAQRRPGLVGAIARWQLVSVLGLAVVTTALVALLVLSGRLYGPDLRERVEALSAARSAHVALLDQQSALRGYAVTGDERFLESYAAGRRALPTHDARVEALVGDEMPDLLLQTRLAEGAWLDGWVDEALAAGRAGGLPGAEADRLLLEGEALFDRYRAAVADLEAELLVARDRAVDRQSSAVTRTALAALAVSAIAGFASWWRGRGLQRWLTGAVGDMQARLGRLRAGDLSGRPDGQSAGPAELEEIHDALDVASAELAQSQSDLQAQTERVALHNRQLGQVLRFAREVAGSLNLRYVLRGLCTATVEIARADRVVVWVRDDAEGQLQAVADSAGPALEPIGVDPVAIGEGVVGGAARFGRIHGLSDDGDLAEPTPALLTGGPVAVPMVVGAEVIGVLELHVSDRTHLAGSTVAVLESLAVQAATAVSAARLHEHTAVMALTDPLTRLPNRRRLDADLAKEVGISQRYGRPVAFAMADVDHFKAYNDELGHQAADVALQALAQLLAGSVRSGDTVYRYGGEELAVVMRETDPGSAELVTDRLRTVVEHHFSAPGQPRPVTISVGVAAMPAHATTGEALVAAADAALYEAKRGGRNKVCSAPDR